MKKPNIILITLDALRADHLGFMGYKKNTSPFMDSLAKRGVVFKKAFSVGAATPQSFPGIMASTYPLDFGGYSPGKMVERAFLAESLQNIGYCTMGFHSNAYLSSYFGYNRGWDIFNYLNHFKETAARPSMRRKTWQFRLSKFIAWRHKISEYSEILGSLFGLIDAFTSTFRKIYRDMTNPIPAYYTAFEMNEVVKKELKEKPKEPLFLWVHYMDAHDPYGLALRKGDSLIQKMKSYLCDYLFTFWSEYPRINKIFEKLYVNMYDEGIRNIDNALKDLFSYLSNTGILNDESSVFITADHGEAFGEHNSFLHAQKAFNENVRIPLVAIIPGKFRDGANEFEIPRSLVDLAPTILEFAGAQKPKSFRGKSLFDESERSVIIELSKHEADLSGIKQTGGAIVRGGYKLIKTSSGKILFSLKDEKEKNNLWDGKNEIASQLENELDNLKHLSVS